MDSHRPFLCSAYQVLNTAMMAVESEIFQIILTGDIGIELHLLHTVLTDL
jgi:hypothetical protein